MNTKKIIEYPILDLQNKKARENWGDFDENQCCLCGKQVGENATFVHYFTNGNITNANDDEVDNSQGCFPVGSECAKKIKKIFNK